MNFRSEQHGGCRCQVVALEGQGVRGNVYGIDRKRATKRNPFVGVHFLDLIIPVASYRPKPNSAVASVVFRAKHRIQFPVENDSWANEQQCTKSLL